MSLFKVKAKVLLTSEEGLELEGRYESMDNIDKNKSWVWRQVSIPFEEVYKIVAYDKDKSLLQTYDGDKMLVRESFDSLNDRWAELREKHTEYNHVEWEEEETTNDE